jgi:hypothetical protein
MSEEDAHANRYHQTLGAKWMVEAIVKDCRTRLRLNRNAQEFANDLERRWEDEAFWRPIAPAAPAPSPEPDDHAYVVRTEDACSCDGVAARHDCEVHGHASAKPAANVGALTQRIRDQQNAPDDGSEPYVVECPSLRDSAKPEACTCAYDVITGTLYQADPCCASHGSVKPAACPTCDSSAPHLHPAIQCGGEVSPCSDAYHCRVTPENTPDKIAEAQCYVAKPAACARCDGSGFVRQQYGSAVACPACNGTGTAGAK